MDQYNEMRIKGDAWMQGGWRERYAMENGNRTIQKDSRGHVFWIYTYDEDRDYQDANGSAYDVTEGRWRD